METVNGRSEVLSPSPMTTELRVEAVSIMNECEYGCKKPHTATAFTCDHPVRAKVKTKRRADTGPRCMRWPNRSINRLVK